MVLSENKVVVLVFIRCFEEMVKIYIVKYSRWCEVINVVIKF